jgi:hypothetical protein
MKSLFAGYYRPTKDEFDELWKKCTFVFDTSVLLDLYRSTAATRGVLLNILEKVRDRIWLPYQAGWEYQENRLKVIAEERALYSELRKTLDGLVTSVQQKMHNHAVESAEKIKEELEQSIKRILAIIDKGDSEHPDLMTEDHIRETITKLFQGKVGQRLDEKRLASIYQDEGPKRYKQKIPPGYKDVEKGETRQFGDLVIWNEMLEQARSSKCPLIFVTSDTKDDWWWRQGQFTIGPRPELVQEIADFAKAKFYMYNVERFLSEAQRRFDTRVEAIAVEKAAEEFKEIEEKRVSEASVQLLRDTLRDDVGGKKPYSFKDRLLQLPASEWRLLGFDDWLSAVKEIRNRPLTQREQDAMKKFFALGDALDSAAKAFGSCWDFADLCAEFIEALSIVPPPVK